MGSGESSAEPERASSFFRASGDGLLSFERAATVFVDREALSVLDDEHSEREERWLTLGLDRTGVLLVVSHTFRAETESSARIRLISARKANKSEVKQYEGKEHET